MMVGTGRQALLGGLLLAAGAAIGWGGARLASPPPAAGDAPQDWVARVGGEYISTEAFAEEMRRRGGLRPGQYQEPEQRRALLDALVYHTALVAAAREAGFDRLPEVQRTIDQVLANQLLQRQLRERQQAVDVPDQAVRAFYEANAAEYTVPGRRRVAMVQIPVNTGGSTGGDDEAWEAAERRAAEALQKAHALDRSLRHFDAVAREYSADQASRYRGGVIGWLTEGQQDRYRHDPALLDAAFALEEPGNIAGPVRGERAVYLVRLVDLQPQQPRGYEQLADGIRQRLLQERLDAVEREWRGQLLDRFEIEVREAALAEVAPVSPPAEQQPPQPPALPVEG